MRFYPETEVLADNGYLLATNSILFAVLVDHINKDEVTFTFDDLNRKRLQLWNCGKQCYFSFSESELPRILRNYKGNFISPAPEKDGKAAWRVDLRFLSNAVNLFDERVLEICYYNEELVKIFRLFKFLDVDIRIFDAPYHAVTSLLRCMFFYNQGYDFSHETFLFGIAKKMKPEGNNKEWLEIMDKLETLEQEGTIITDVTPELRMKVMGETKKLENLVES